MLVITLAHNVVHSQANVCDQLSVRMYLECVAEAVVLFTSCVGSIFLDASGILAKIEMPRFDLHSTKPYSYNYQMMPYPDCIGLIVSCPVKSDLPVSHLLP
jgi:hypothetical protein